MTAEDVVEHRERLYRKAFDKVLYMRRQTADETEFGRLAAPVIDMLVTDLELLPPLPSSGPWTEHEREVMRWAYAQKPKWRCIDLAATRLNRTRSQIMSMSRNMKLS